MLFSRLQKRGPIEAYGSFEYDDVSCRFHAYKSVAPLKPYRHVLHAGPVCGFSRLQKRGPIEAGRIVAGGEA